MNNLPTNIPELIFELGRLQVFHYPTIEEIAANKQPHTVYWQDKESKHTYGPFPSVYGAMSHFTWITHMQKRAPDATSENNVVYMDFVKKKRIIFEMP